MSTVKNNGATNVKPVRPNFGNTNRPNLVNTTLNSSSADDIDIDFDEDELLSIDDPVENAPITEKEQQEQIPIQPVTPVQNTNKKVKQPKEKKVKRPKTHNVHKEKSKTVDNNAERTGLNKNTVIAIAGAVTVVLGVITIISIILGNRNNQHIKVVDNTYVMQLNQTEEVDYTAVSSTTTSEGNNANTDDVITEVENSGVVTVEQSKANPLEINQFTKIPFIVNTKTADDKEYTDHNTEVDIELSNVIQGYDNVMAYIDEFNESSNKVITLPSKEEYQENFTGMQLVIYEFTVQYPDNFPTTASSGIIYSIAQLTPELYGKVENIENEEITKEPSSYIVTDETISEISSFNDISILPDKLNVGESVTYRYITSLPVGANNENYGLSVKLVIDSNEKDIYFKGIDIK